MTGERAAGTGRGAPAGRGQTGRAGPADGEAEPGNPAGPDGHPQAGQWPDRTGVRPPRHRRDRTGRGRWRIVPTRLRELLRDLSGRTDRVLAELIVDQLATTGAGVSLAAALSRGDLPAAIARARIAGIEHEGDNRRHVLISHLHRSVSSPIDREDLFRLSRCVDDVLDAVRDFVREADLFDAGAHPAYRPVLDALARGVAELTEAVRLLPRAPREAAEHALLARKQGLRTEYQHAVAGLLAAPLTAETLKVTLLLGRLDTAGVQLSTAADALADGVIKRFQ